MRRRRTIGAVFVLYHNFEGNGTMVRESNVCWMEEAQVHASFGKKTPDWSEEPVPPNLEGPVTFAKNDAPGRSRVRCVEDKCLATPHGTLVP